MCSTMGLMEASRYMIAFWLIIASVSFSLALGLSIVRVAGVVYTLGLLEKGYVSILLKAVVVAGVLAVLAATTLEWY